MQRVSAVSCAPRVRHNSPHDWRARGAAGPAAESCQRPATCRLNVQSAISGAGAIPGARPKEQDRAQPTVRAFRQPPGHHRRAGKDLRRAAAGVRPDGRPGQPQPGWRGHVELADHRPAGGLAQPRQGFQDLRRGRQRVRRPARRVRRGAGRPRPPGHGGGGARPGRPGHALRPAHPGRGRGRRGTCPPVRPAAVALRQLGYRGDHGRGAPDARHHRPRPDHQGGGLLPRPPRLGPGIGGPGGRGGRPGRPTRSRCRPVPASPRRSCG